VSPVESLQLKTVHDAKLHTVGGTANNKDYKHQFKHETVRTDDTCFLNMFIWVPMPAENEIPYLYN
jgi:hypothetical protein